MKSRVFCWLLSLAMAFLSGCVYLRHFDDAMFMKGLGDSQKDMQAALARQEKLYNRLKSDIERGRLKGETGKQRIVRLYGEPVLCKPAEDQPGIKETCLYRNPAGGIFTEIILLDFGVRGKLSSWEIQKAEEKSAGPW